MEGALGGGTDPVPYILGAYLVGSILLLGFGIQILRQRAKLRGLLEAIRKH
jgi:hypothetical protein